MVLGINSINLGNSLGFWGLLSLIPFIIIYLIRPKPKQMEIPSLMFFLQQKDHPRQQSFFRNFARDWLFLIHLLILLLFVSQLIEPFTKYEHDITAENTVVVLDVSASSQVREGSTTRFELGKQFAIENLGEKNTLILAKAVPKILIQDALYDDAVTEIKALTPTESPTSLGEAIVLAGEVLSDREGRVIVISDFLNTEGVDANTAKNVLSTKGIVVDYINTASGDRRSNVGIIDMEIDDDTTTLFIRNFNEELEDVSLTVGDFSKTIPIPAKSTETFSFATPSASVEINLKNKDDFPVDNKASLQVPQNKEINVLIITNNASVFLKNAVTSSESIKVDVAEPPIIPSTDYDVYIIDAVDPNLILPGTFNDLFAKVKDGASVIVNAQPGMGALDYRGLLAITVTGEGPAELVTLEQINRFTKHVGSDFGSVKNYIQAETKSGGVTIAKAGESTVMAFLQEGSGKLFYYGLMEGASDFKFNPDYPIFWVKLLEFLTNQEKIENINVQTGESSVLDSVTTIKTPRKTLKQNVLLFEESGTYTVGDRRIASNLLDQQESTINAADFEAGVAAEPGKEVELKPVTEEREYSFVVPLLIAVCVLLFLELIYVKIRGDF